MNSIKCVDYRLQVLMSVCLLGVVLLASACNRQMNGGESIENPTRTTVQFQPDPALHEQLAVLDFSDLMNELIASSSQIRETDDSWSMDTARVKVAADDPLLTPTELEMIHGLHYMSGFGGKEYVNEQFNQLPDTADPEYVRVAPYTSTPFFEFRDFRELTDRNPVDGIELFMFWTHVQRANPDWPDLSTQAGMTEFMSWESGRQLDFALRFINPLTGRFFGNFGDTQWSAGEFRARAATEEDIQDKASAEVAILQHHNEELPGGTLLTLYGEREGVVLAEQLSLDLPHDSVLLNLRNAYPSGEVILE